MKNEIGNTTEKLILQVASLEKTIEDSKKNASNVQSDFEDLVSNKDEVIQTLLEQQQVMGNIINLTRRLMNNCTITVIAESEKDYYIRNYQYYQNQFRQQSEKFKQLNFDSSKEFNLLTVPQMFEVENESADTNQETNVSGN